MYLFLARLLPNEVMAVARGANVWELLELIQEHPERLLNLEEAWCALHFLLTGEVPILKYEALARGTPWHDESLENILMGGSPTSFDNPFGVTRYVTPEEVASLAPRLAAVSGTDLQAWYDPALLRENSIPPAVWRDGSPLPPWLSDKFMQLKRFYGDCAVEGHGLLVYTS